MHTDMTGFDEALMKNPFDWELRRIYADYLEDQGEEAKAAFQRFAAEVEVIPTQDLGLMFQLKNPWQKRAHDKTLNALVMDTKLEHRNRMRQKQYAALLDLEDAFVKLYLTGWRPTILPREQP